VVTKVCLSTDGERRPGSDGGDILAEQFRHFSKFVR
jgi:hypothetical protein